MGFSFTVAGITVALSDIKVVENKDEKIEYGKKKAEELMYGRRKGKLTMQEWETHLTSFGIRLKTKSGMS